MAWLLVRALKLTSPVGRVFVFFAPLLASFVSLLRLMPEAKQEIVAVCFTLALLLATRDAFRYLSFRKRIVDRGERFSRAETIGNPLVARLNLLPVRIYMSDALTCGPVVLGFLRPSIVFARSMALQLGDEEIRVLLAHELAHIYRRDFVLKWVLLFLRRLSIWNPVASWPYRWLSNEIEFACDRIACRLTGKPGTLARTLCKIEAIQSFRSERELRSFEAIPRADCALRARIDYLAFSTTYSFEWSNLVKTLAIFSVFWLVCFRPAAFVLSLVN